MSRLAASNTLPSAAVTAMSGSNVRYIERTSSPNPLNTESRITSAATGTPTANALTPEMMLITECDLRASR